MKIIALDPGLTTGYATGLVDDGKLLVVTGQDKWMHSQLWGFLEGNEPDVVISERFEYRNKARKGLELYSRELIGVAELYMQLNGPPPHKLVMQNPMKDNPSTYFNDARLKKDNIYKPERDHSNDAARHLLYYWQFGAGFQFNTNGYEGVA